MTDFKPGDRALVQVEILDPPGPHGTAAYTELVGNPAYRPFLREDHLTPVPSLEDVARVIREHSASEFRIRPPAREVLCCKCGAEWNIKIGPRWLPHHQAREVMRLFLGDLDAKSPGRTVGDQPTSGVEEE